METSHNEMKRRIFRQELFLMKVKGYLSDELVETVEKAHHQFHLDLVAEQQKKIETERISLPEVIAVPKKPQKVKKVLTPEEMRERNISWLLNLGVIMLLIGGLFVATSNWESMTALMKSGSIAAVSLLFYGFAYLSNRVLNIEKTSFAFTVLGSLFLPIFILSLGWFSLLGSYLSISGEGSQYLGVLGGFLPIAVYVYFANKLNSRLFVWFSYVSLTIGTAFLLAAIHLSIDYFYLGMVIFNALLVYSFYYLSKMKRFPLFMKELVLFSQINLVMSTLTMIFLYDQHVVNSFNLLLTAAIYLSMIFVTGKKEYHFIFSTMVVYGAYQLIEHSFLVSAGPILFALIPALFLILPRFINVTDVLSKIFRMTSAVISILAFIYISLEGLMLRIGEPSIVLLIAYVIIGTHFVIMCYFFKNTLFNYLSPVFYSAALLQFTLLIDKLIFPISLSLEIYVAGFLLFILFGSAKLVSKLSIIRNSSRDVGLVIMLIGVIIAQGLGQWWELGTMLLAFGLVCYLLIKMENSSIYLEFAQWIMPISIGLAVVSFNQEICLHSYLYQEHYGISVGFTIGSIVVLLFSLIWSKLEDKLLEKNSFYTSQILYSVAMILSVIGPIDELWVRPAIFIGGVYMYHLLYRRTQSRVVPYLMGITSLIFYLTVLVSVERQWGIPESFNAHVFPIGAILLLVISFILKGKSAQLFQGFSWIGHLFYAFSLAFSFIVYQQESFWSFLIANLVYLLSLRLFSEGWKRYAFMYASFTSLYVSVVTGLNRELYEYQDFHSFVISSVIIVVIWFFMNEFYRKATMFYWVPFSLIGIVSCIISGPYNISLFFITLSYIIMVLIFIHLVKWVFIPTVPLFLSLLSTVKFTLLSRWDITYDFLIVMGMGVILFLIGKALYKKLVEEKENSWPEVDSYTFSSIAYFLYMYTLNIEHIWLHAVPGLFISIAIYFQRGRFQEKWSSLLALISSIILLEPYYSVTMRLNIPALWEREMLVLPWIVLIIFLRISMKGRFDQITSRIQWAVLVLVALLLIQDGLASSTIYDAIILGSLSLISLLTGMFLRIKSYFIVGSGVLLLNVFLQTKPFWGNMPWWAYLLIVGSILIFVASYNEWQKQKTAKGEETYFLVLKEKIVQKWKEWN
jgi:hypothetical protein